MYRVRTREGSSELTTNALRNVVYRYTRAGRGSIHLMLNRMLARAKGRDLIDPSIPRKFTILLVMAVRLLWSDKTHLE